MLNIITPENPPKATAANGSSKINNDKLLSRLKTVRAVNRPMHAFRRRKVS